MAMTSLAMSADELIAYLKHSSLPTLLVEGASDRALIRRVEAELRAEKVDILPVGGKGKLHEVYLRRFETGGSQVQFLRDRDELVVRAAPVDFADYILTNGYSIENDVLHRETIVRLAGDRLNLVDLCLAMVAEWFKHAFSAFLSGVEIELSRDVDFILDNGVYANEAREEMAAYQQSQEVVERCSGDLWVWLRGKTLLRSIQKILAGGSPAYSKDQIIDLSIKLGPSESFLNLRNRIRAAFSIHE